ncbi:hypothetical protein [Macrococcoides caseolyticum]|uniref:hypothetical protein n=1 Tax=Macrococcoides caseolyticum TaxID=69966 RepID=UPI001F349D6A|nr:hypothetical protein [Macrococcus caseolyticus]MCE4956275.1 hypothetical protein [Macrococcus caseolyticus]
MIEALTFYFRTMFDTKLSIDLKRYKQQNMISFFIVVFVSGVFFYLIKDQPSVYNENFYKLSEARQNELLVRNKIPFVIGTTVIFLSFRLLDLPNEIHRANRTKLNWKKRTAIMLFIVLAYFIIIGWQIWDNRPTFLGITWVILLLTNFCFEKNNKPTEEEKLQEEKLNKEEEND